MSWLLLLACPVCAAVDESAGATARTVALGAMVLTPFAVVGTAAWVLRRLAVNER